MRLLSLLPFLAPALAFADPTLDTLEPSSRLAADAFQALASDSASARATRTITHPQAMGVVSAAIRKASEMRMPSNIAITDPAGHLIVFLRMDGALLVSLDIALKKAKTVSMFGGKFKTQDLFNATAPGGALYGIQQTNNGLIFIGGGIPLKVKDQFLGALGVSGGTVEQDLAIATAGAEALATLV